MLANRLEQPHVLGGVGSAALRIKRNRAEGTVLAQQRGNEHTAEPLHDVVRHADKVEFRSGVAHRAPVSDHPTSDSIAYPNPPAGKHLCLLTDGVRRDRFT